MMDSGPSGGGGGAGPGNSPPLPRLDTDEQLQDSDEELEQADQPGPSGSTYGTDEAQQFDLAERALEEEEALNADDALDPDDLDLRSDKDWQRDPLALAWPPEARPLNMAADGLARAAALTRLADRFATSLEWQLHHNESEPLHVPLVPVPGLPHTPHRDRVTPYFVRLLRENYRRERAVHRYRAAHPGLNDWQTGMLVVSLIRYGFVPESLPTQMPTGPEWVRWSRGLAARASQVRRQLRATQRQSIAARRQQMDRERREALDQFRMDMDTMEKLRGIEANDQQNESFDGQPGQYSHSATLEYAVMLESELKHPEGESLDVGPQHESLEPGWADSVDPEALRAERNHMRRRRAWARWLRPRRHYITPYQEHAARQMIMDRGIVPTVPPRDPSVPVQIADIASLGSTQFDRPLGWREQEQQRLAEDQARQAQRLAQLEQEDRALESEWREARDAVDDDDDPNMGLTFSYPPGEPNDERMEINRIMQRINMVKLTQARIEAEKRRGLAWAVEYGLPPPLTAPRPPDWDRTGRAAHRAVLNTFRWLAWLDYARAYPGVATADGEPLNAAGQALFDRFYQGDQPEPPPPQADPDPIVIPPQQRLDSQIAYYTAIGHIVTGDEEPASSLPPLVPDDDDATQPSSSGSTWIAETPGHATPMERGQDYAYHVDESGEYEAGPGHAMDIAGQVDGLLRSWEPAANYLQPIANNPSASLLPSHQATVAHLTQATGQPGATGAASGFLGEMLEALYDLLP
jgi:hypothetical protein